MIVPFIDLTREWQYFEKDFIQQFLDFGRSGHYVLGDYVVSFENNFAAANNYKYAVGVSSGLAALEIALLAEGIGPGDEVITAPNSAVATALAISNIGARPIFCDIKDDYLIDENKIEKLITDKTKAILPVHLFGKIANLEMINELANQHSLKVIEDACQAHGASFSSLSELTNTKAFSFYPTKNLGALGEGGLVLTNSEEVRDFAAYYRNYGQKERYHHLYKGNNYRLDALQSVFLDLKLKKLPDFIKTRREIAKKYCELLSGIKQLTIPAYEATAAYHLFVIRVLGGERDGLQAFLKERGIDTMIHYPVLIYQQPCYIEYQDLSLLKAEAMQAEILSLPCYHFLTPEEQAYVIEQINKFFN